MCSLAQTCAPVPLRVLADYRHAACAHLTVRPWCRTHAEQPCTYAPGPCPSWKHMPQGLRSLPAANYYMLRPPKASIHAHSLMQAADSRSGSMDTPRRQLPRTCRQSCTVTVRDLGTGGMGTASPMMGSKQWDCRPHACTHEEEDQDLSTKLFWMHWQQLELVYGSVRPMPSQTAIKPDLWCHVSSCDAPAVPCCVHGPSRTWHCCVLCSVPPKMSSTMESFHDLQWVCAWQT